MHERDGQTDRRTDGRTPDDSKSESSDHGPRLRIASRGKNHAFVLSKTRVELEFES